MYSEMFFLKKRRDFYTPISLVAYGISFSGQNLKC
jgi:hypothetical protein